MRGAGLKPGLPAEQGNDRAAELFNGHGQQRNGNLLACGHQHIHLPLAGVGIDLLRLRNQVVRGVSLSGNHDHDVVSLSVGIGDELGHPHHPFGIGNRAAAEFLYYQHGNP